MLCYTILIATDILTKQWVVTRSCHVTVILVEVPVLALPGTRLFIFVECHQSVIQLVNNIHDKIRQFAHVCFASLPGVIVVPGGAIGTVLGGWAIKRFHMTILQIMKTELVLTILLVCSGFMFFIICSPVPFAGVNRPYNGRYLWHLRVWP